MCCAVRSSWTTARTCSDGGETISTPGRPRFTAGRPRSSAISSRSECWGFLVPAADISGEVRHAIAAAAKESLRFNHARLTELGGDELLESEPQLAVVTLFEEMGRLRLTGPALDSVVLAAVGGPYPWATTRVLYPVPGQRGASLAGSQLSGLTFDVVEKTIEQVLCPVPTPAGIELQVVPARAGRALPAGARGTVRVGGLYKPAGLYRVTAEVSAANPGRTEEGWAAGLMAARRALAHELIGVTGDLLAIVVGHVTVREQ